MKKINEDIISANSDNHQVYDKRIILKKLIEQLKKYELFEYFSSEEELENWIMRLNSRQLNNFLYLNISREEIKFSPKLLLNKDLLNTEDYATRVIAIASIKNAEGWYHLFDRMLKPVFLNSPKFYQDIETLKRAKSAQMPLWIIGDKTFIQSPFHDEDFEVLVTSRDTSSKDCDFLVWDAIATVACNEYSIQSGFHQEDIKTIIKYSAPSLQGSSTYPKGSIDNLAVNRVSLKDKDYHLENMEILAQNTEIGNFLYAIMSNKKSVYSKHYRAIINEMVEHRENKRYAFLLCIYALGEEEAKMALNIQQLNYYNEIIAQYDIDDLLIMVDERLRTLYSDNPNGRKLIETPQPKGLGIKFQNIIKGITQKN